MSVLRNMYARSEQWRIEWGCRTCISVAAVTFLYLWSPTKEYLTQYGPASASFATVVTAFVKDITLGATLTNAWTSILGAFISTLVGWIYFLVVRQYYEDSDPLLLTLLFIFIFVFILQYLEMVPVTKKFAVGMIPLNLIGYRNEANPSFYVWGLFVAVCIGSACAVVGCVVPLPIRLAGTELKERVYYYSEAMSSLINEMARSWLSSYKASPQNTTLAASTGRNASNSICSNLSASPDRTIRKNSAAVRDSRPPTSTTTDTKPFITTENRHWRKLRVVIRAISILMRYSTLTAMHSKRRFNTRFIRLELVNFLHEGLPFLLSRNQEAKFGPSRRVAMRCARYVKLIQDMLLIITKIETHLENMEKMPKYHYLYVAFLSRLNLQYALLRYASCLSEVIQSVSSVLAVQSSLHDALLHASEEGFRAVQAAAMLVQARAHFDSEYLKARRDIFYPDIHHGDDFPDINNQTNTTNGTASGNPAYSPPETTAFGFSSASVLQEEAASAAPTKDTNTDTAAEKKDAKTPSNALRVQAKAMIDVNSVLFLLDTMSRLLLEFWSLEDLAALSQHEALNPGTFNNDMEYPLDCVQDEAPMSEKLSSTTHDISKRSVANASPSYNTLVKFYNGCGKFVYELFPTRQSHLMCFSFTPTVSFTVTQAVRDRLMMSFKVALAMTLLALYGISNHRPQPSLASFTIAFLAGGAVSGINVMTCINRAAGTAVASVYAIMVTFIISSWTSDWARDLFIGFAVVLMQLPSTYVRSYPLYAYAGIVTGFTVALLLLPRHLSTAVAVNRIIDTYVAVFTYLVLEFALAATFTENEIIADMMRVFEGLEDRFINFHRNFQYFKAAEDSCAEVSNRIRGGTLTPLEVDSELQKIAQLRADMAARKELEVESIQVLIRRQILLAPFYRSEPAVLRPAVFPAALLQEAVTLQQQAVNSIQIMIWAVKACDGSYNDRVENLVKKVHRKIKHVSSTKLLSGKAEWSNRASVGTESSATSISEVELSTLIQRQQSYSTIAGSLPSPSAKEKEVISILPEFKTLLLPLEPHFIGVEQFVSAVLVFLTAAMEQIGDWQMALKATREPITYRRRATAAAGGSTSATGSSAGMLSQLAAVAQTRHAAQLGHITSEFPHTIYEQLTYGKDDTFDRVGVDQLYGNYQDLVLSLQRKLNADGVDADEGEQQGPRRIPSNREIIIVNTLLASTQQLIAALHGLTSVVSRLQAHRDIHVTQDGRKTL